MLSQRGNILIEQKSYPRAQRTFNGLCKWIVFINIFLKQIYFRSIDLSLEKCGYTSPTCSKCSKSGQNFTIWFFKRQIDLWVIWTELANSYFKRIEKRGFMMTLPAYFPDQCSQYASESRLVLLLFHATGRPLPSTRQNHFMLEISSPTWLWQGRQTHKSDVVKNTVMWTFL